MNIYTLITDNYTLDIAKGLADSGHNIAAVEINTIIPERRPKGLDEFIDKYSPKIYYEEIVYSIETFKNRSDPDLSIITPNFLFKNSEYIRMMLLLMDRLYFTPLSQHEAQRIVYMYLANAYRMLKDCEVDVVFVQSIPHGLPQIALFAAAKSLGVQFIYRSGIAPTHSVTYLEEELLPRKRVEYQEIKTLSKNFKEQINFSDYESQLFLEIPEVVAFKNSSKPNKLKQLAQLILTVIRGKRGDYKVSQFFLEKEKSKLVLIYSILNYHFNREKQIRFIKDIEVEPNLNENYFIYFLHFQPESTTTPEADYFSDQLLNLQIILSALPLDAILYVKEHPGQRDVKSNYGQDLHYRSMDFYKEIVKDNRVKLISNNLESEKLIINSRAIFSTCGSVTWEAINLGKPAIVFSYLWCVSCASCYIAYSSNDVKTALFDALKKSSSDVYEDREIFIKSFFNLIVFAPESRRLPTFLKNESNDYELALANVVDSINQTIKAF